MEEWKINTFFFLLVSNSHHYQLSFKSSAQYMMWALKKNIHVLCTIPFTLFFTDASVRTEWILSLGVFCTIAVISGEHRLSRHSSRGSLSVRLAFKKRLTSAALLIITTTWSNRGDKDIFKEQSQCLPVHSHSLTPQTQWCT